MANSNQRRLRKAYQKAQKLVGKPSARPASLPAHGRKTNVGDIQDQKLK